jgi:ABC-type branched-subunit amino acid transport system substrate-binding protein
MEKLGKLKGHKLGLLVDQGTAQSMAESGLVSELSRLGYKLTYKAVVSNDPSQGPAQVPPQVLQMQRAGVDTVFMASAFWNISAFANQADKQGWHPQYAVSDLIGDDIATLLAGMPNSFDGAIATTYYAPGGDKTSTKPLPESSVGRDCRERWNKATGENVTAKDSSYAQIVGVCTDVLLLTKSATAAGTTLTRQGFTNAVQNLGRSFDFGGMGGHFGPGKTDYNDVVRTMVWGPADPKTVDGYCTSNRSRCFNDGIPPYDPGV